MSGTGGFTLFSLYLPRNFVSGPFFPVFYEEEYLHLDCSSPAQTHTGMQKYRGEVPRKGKGFSFPTMTLVGESMELGIRQRWAKWAAVPFIGTRVSQQLLGVSANVRVRYAPHILGTPAMPSIYRWYENLARRLIPPFKYSRL